MLCVGACVAWSTSGYCPPALSQTVFLPCSQLTFQLLGIVLSLLLICPRCAGTTDALGYLLCLFWAAGSIKVRSSCLYDKHCIHWAISTAHVFLLCVYVSCMWIYMGLVCGWMEVKRCLFSSFSNLFFEMRSFESGTHWLDYILSKHPRLKVCTATSGIFFMGV